MTATFKPSRDLSLYRAVKVVRLVGAPPVIIALIVSVLMAAAAWFLVVLVLPTPSLLGGTLILSSIASGLLLLFTYATTNLAALVPARTINDLLTGNQATSNVALSADAALLKTFDQLPSRRRPALADIAAVVIQSPAAKRFLEYIQIPREEFADVVATHLLPQLPEQEFWQASLRAAENRHASYLTLEDIVGSWLLHPSLKSYLRQYDLQEKDISFAVWWVTSWRSYQASIARWWEKNNLLSFTGVGLSWTAGFTPLVDQFARFPAGNLWDQIIFGREQHVDQLITTLARERQSNVLLVGQPGTGRLGVVLEMARRVRTSSAHPAVNGQRVVYLHVGEVLARGTSNAAQLAVVSQVLAEMERAGNIIAVIDGLGSILGEEGEVRLNLSDVLLPFFSSLSVRVVVIISSEEYHLRLKSNEELAHFFEVVRVEDISPEATLQVLAYATPHLERTHKLTLPYKALRAIVETTEAILPHIPYPERAFDVLEEAIVVAQQREKTIITSEDIEKLISEKVGIPVGRVRREESEHLLSLETIMHERVVNQQRAVATLARAMIRARAGVRSRERPIGVFLFLGPTGVGKTETAKTLAAAYFGSEQHITRLDMSEFQTVESISSLIGGATQPVGRLTSAITDHPFTVVLLDEFEKAHPTIHQLFLQVFDEGRLTDARGHLVSFRHAIIIATSNAGAELIRTTLAHGPFPPTFDDDLRDHILRTNIFRPELLNRFDGVITFTPLSPEHIREIATIMLRKLNQRLDQEHGFTITVTPDVVDYLVSVGYHPEFGARPMARAIQDSVEYYIAQRILKGSFTPGQPITIPVRELAPILPPR